MKSTIANKVSALVVGGAMAMSMCAPALAFADNGLQDGTQAYDSGVYEENVNNGWDPATNSGVGGEGQIQIIYTTDGGNWIAPSDVDENEDGTVDGEGDTPGGTHENGTYMVTLPKLIKYEGMNAGKVQESVDYSVRVNGVIDGDKKVVLAADSTVALATDEGAGGITATTTQNKTEWSADEVFGTVNGNGSLAGTSTTDNISLSGIAKTAGDYKGVVQYTSSLVNA